MMDLEAVIRIRVEQEVSKQMKAARDEILRVQGAARQATQFTKAFFGSFIGPLGAAGAGLAMAALVKNVVQTSAALQEMNNRAQVVFGAGFGLAQQSAQRLGQEMKRSASDVLGLMTTFDLVAKGLGVGGKAAEDMSEDLAKLSIQFSKAMGGTQEEAAHAIEMGLIGSGRALRQYNVILNDTVLTEYLASKGSKIRAEDLDQESKAVATYNFLLEKTQEIQQAAGKNTGTLRDRTDELKGAWNDLGESMGSPFLGIVKDNVFILTSALKGLLTYVDGVRDRIAVMQGKNLPADGFFQGRIGDESFYEQEEKQRSNWVGNLKSTSDEAAKQHEKVKKAMEELAKTYAEKSKDIAEDVKELDYEHGQNMKHLQEQIDDTGRSIRRLADDYKRAMQDIDKAEGDTILKGEERVKDLEKRLAEKLLDKERANSGSGSVSVELNSDIEEIQAELAKEKAGLADVMARAPAGATAQANERRDLTDTQRDFADAEERRALAGGENKERNEDLDREMKKLQEKKETDTRVYANMRRQYAETQQALDTWKSEYEATLLHMDSVTQDVVDSMVSKLEEITGTISKINAVMEANAGLTGGGSLADRAADRAGVGGAGGSAGSGGAAAGGGSSAAAPDLSAFFRSGAGEDNSQSVLEARQRQADATAASRASQAAAEAAAAAYTAQLQARRRATGGFASGLTEVGELGPELVELPTGSYVHSNRDSQKMVSGGASITIHIGTVQMKSDADVDAVARMLARKIQQQSLLPV